MKKIASILTIVILVAVGAAVYLNGQWLIDSAVAARYQPAQDIQEITRQLKLTPEGERYFSVGQPVIANQETFNKKCQKQHEKSIVLGCYIAPFHIYIYDVTDERLNGVKQVTAAHEMLHVAYDRLSTHEKERIGKLLEAALPAIEEKDEQLTERLAIYEKTEPGERYNELHSILGTETENLPDELEEYYSTYFTDRQVVANYAQQYTRIFMNLKNDQGTLVADLKTLADEIYTETDSLNQDIEQLKTSIQVFNQRATTSGSFTTQEEFDRERRELTDKKARLDARREALNQRIESYNKKRSDLQKLNVQVEELNAKLDSTSEVPSL